jgi:hypothetical protein
MFRLFHGGACVVDLKKKSLPHDFGAIEFELTDVHSAREVLDENPPGLDGIKRLEPGYWEAQRRTPVPTDRAMAGVTLDWLLGLPAQVRPNQTAERYPRVANRIAQAWLNGQRCEETLNELLLDHRGGRRGFPPEVELELRSLKEYRAGLLGQ